MIRHLLAGLLLAACLSGLSREALGGESEVVQPPRGTFRMREELKGKHPRLYFTRADIPEIRRQARFAIRRCAPGGGFILGSSHNIPIATRYENFTAMLEVIFREGEYPLA